MIVVNDGSTDETGVVASRYRGVRVIDQPNRGPSAARNTGAAAASGDVLLFLDADDELLPGAVVSLKRALHSFPEAGAVVANRVLHHPGSERLLWSNLTEDEVLGRENVPRLILGNDLGMDAAVRRGVWWRHPFREDLRASEDQAFWIELLVAGVPIVKLAKVLLRYEVGRQGAASTAKKFMRRQRRQLFHDLSKREDLTRGERMLSRWMGVRAGIGAVLAR